MAVTLRATNDDLNFIGEDVSTIVRLMSQQETPFLDLLPTAQNPATSPIHLWQSRELVPDSLIASTALAASTANAGVQINGFGNQLQTGMLVELDTGGSIQEVARIASIAGPNSLLLSRAYNGQTSSLAAGANLFVLSTANKEGADTIGDVTRPRSEYSNFTQIFMKPITFSGTLRASRFNVDLGDEFELQVANRTIELMKDFEKSLLRGVSSNSIMDTGTYRTMGGLRSYLTAINSTVDANSFSAAPLDYVNDILQQCWSAGARDLDTVVVGPQWKRELSTTNASKLFIAQTEQGVTRKISQLTTDFGDVEVVLSPYLADRHLMAVSRQRIIPINLRGRAFQREDLAKTGDASKAHVIGEYTAEFHGPEKMGQLRVG